MDYFDKNEFIIKTFEMAKAEHLKNRIDNIIANSPYSTEINQAVFTVEEIEMYKKLALKEIHTTRTVLVADIDVDFVDNNGKSNLEKMLKGEPPIDPITNTVYVIHHIGQNYDSPFAELPKFYHSQKYYSAFHKKYIDSWRADHQLVNLTNKEFSEHWKIRGKQYNAPKQFGT